MSGTLGTIRVNIPAIVFQLQWSNVKHNAAEYCLLVRIIRIQCKKPWRTAHVVCLFAYLKAESRNTLIRMRHKPED